MSRALNESLDVQAVCDRIREYTSHLMDTTNLYVALLDPENELITFPLYAEGNRVQDRSKAKNPVHGAAVIGDTVGDPCKDTSGPSLNILIKLMSMVAVVFAGLVVRYAPMIFGG